MASHCSHASWYLRFRHVAGALRPGLCEDDAFEEWQEARLRMPAPAAYFRLLEGHLAAAQAAADAPGAGAACSEADAEAPGAAGFVAPQWLPKWCRAREPGPRGPKEEEEDGGPADGDEDCPAEPSPASPRGKAAPSAAPAATLWFGDIPTELANEKRITEALHMCKPSTMPTPFVKKVVRQGYKGVPGQATGCLERPPGWLGYAFLAFRDEEEAREALDHFNGRETRGWVIRTLWAAERHQGRVTQGQRLGPRLAAGGDPPLGEQLFPASLHGQELAAAIERHRLATGAVLPSGTEAWVAAEVVRACYRRSPRREHRLAGAAIPPALAERVLAGLRRTRWPPAPHRSGMQAEHYLVLHRGKGNDGYEDLLALLEDLLQWADPSFGCNRIAVTKDFQGSPHIDMSDVTFQYAASFGSFNCGGELCIEGDQPSEVYVVDTHDRVARIDGRFVHWVRGYSGGDRYSVIFFSTQPDCFTERTAPVAADFAPMGRMF